jgi:hypothetical protein
LEELQNTTKKFNEEITIQNNTTQHKEKTWVIRNKIPIM